MPPTKNKPNRGQRAPSSATKQAVPTQSPKTSAPSVPSAPRTTPRRTPRTSRRKSSQWPWIAAGAIVLVLIVGFFLYRQTSAIPGVESFSGLGRDHLDTPVTYAQVPPVGGDHNPVPQKCDVYTEPVPNEKAVHSMEHGAVWITYQPNLPADQLAQLTQIARGQSYILLSPYPGLPTPVVASAWGLQLKLDNASDARLPQFIKAYRQGPQTPEPGATC